MWGQHHAPATLTPRKEPPVTIGQEAVWAPGSVWTLWSSEKSFPCRESNSGRPARSSSLYRLSYPGPIKALCSARMLSEIRLMGRSRCTRIMNVIMGTRLRSTIQSCHGLKKTCINLLRWSDSDWNSKEAPPEHESSIIDSWLFEITRQPYAGNDV
jgi:hypothetical protein